MTLLPDKLYVSVAQITPAELLAQGVLGLILDVDNTLAARQAAMPDKPVMEWIKTLRAAGVGLYVLSNNRRGRVTRFSQAMGVPAIHMGMKPFPFAFTRAVRGLGLPKSAVAAVGDQIYTDVFGAHLAGLRAFLVRPIASKESFFVDARRLFEQPVLALYRRRHPGEHV